MEKPDENHDDRVVRVEILDELDHVKVAHDLPEKKNTPE
jgi:hypothetical protein